MENQIVKLIAIPFDIYKSKETSEGVVYNVCTLGKTVYAQIWVTHHKYALHDLCVDNISGAPATVKINLNKHLDQIFGKDGWKMKTVLSKQHVSTDNNLQQGFIFNPQAVAIGYDKSNENVISNNICINANYGVV